jgi:hypothetical protein
MGDTISERIALSTRSAADRRSTLAPGGAVGDDGPPARELNPVGLLSLSSRTTDPEP